jgi:hypothetical protein
MSEITQENPMLLFQSRNRFPLLLAMACLLASAWAVGAAQARVTITAAIGGSAISADTAASSWTTLTGPIAVESNNTGAVGTGTIILTAPSGFAFNTSAAVSVKVTGGSTASYNINHIANGSTFLPTSVTASAITITITSASTGSGNYNTLTWQGIQIRPTAGTPLASGNLTRSGTAALNNLTLSTGTWGALTEVGGTVTQLAFTTQPAGATAGAAFTTQPVVRSKDQFGNNSTNGLPATSFVAVTLTSGSGPLQGTTSVDLGTSAGKGIATYSGLRIDVTGSNKQLTATSTNGLPSVPSTVFAVAPAAASKLVIATQPSATATAGVAFAQQPVIWIEDAYNNVRSNDTLTVTATRSAGAGTLQGTTSMAAVGGVARFTNLAHTVATNITIQFASGTLTAATSSAIAVSVGPSFSGLLVLLPGETAVPGSTTGRTGTPTAQNVGTAFSVTVSAVDAYWNLLNTVTDVVSITSSDPTALLPANAALVNGTISFSVTLKRAGSQTVTATDITSGHPTGTSSAVTVNKGTFAKLQLLVPGESVAPGTTTGKTGTPTAQLVGTAFNVSVNSVDDYWNLISTNDTIKITSSDSTATLPVNAALVGGTKSFSVTLGIAGTPTITASNVTHSAVTPSTSPPIGVYYVSAVAQPRPVVAIHDSELTRALERAQATGSTPSGAGTTGYQWWPTNWHYFVMPESVKEALRSDGTGYEMVGDQDISSGRLLAANGQPRCPIVVSLAAEAIREDEIAPLTNYIAAGGTLLVGSSAFTRNTDGSTRGDFALASQMGLHMVNTNLQNWTTNSSFAKVVDHSLVSHVPWGVLKWHLPSAAEEVSWGISPTHVIPESHSLWQVQSSDAVVVAWGDAYPYLSVKQYGKGTIIYCSAMQPLLGHGGYAPGMYSYGILRKAIELAFASSRLPVPKLSPWPYAYDAALTVRHDFEDYQDMINSIEASAQFESTNGAKGDYYFCTGTLRAEMGNSATTIASLRRAVTNYGATIGPHNGGLKNPNNTNVVQSDYEYWHWGPDEALDVTPPGYTSGSQYATVSISNSFNDIEGWLSGITNGLRTWVSPYFNATRDASCGVVAQLGVKTCGEQKLSPFPGWVLSTSLQTPGKRYPLVSLPVSDWYVGSEVAQSMEAGHTVDSMKAAVDFYYSLGALINLYSHSSSAGAGAAGPLEGQYVIYSMTKPRLWAANAVGVYSWWLARSNAQVIPSYSISGNQGVTTLAIKGATDPRTAVEIIIPQASFYGLQVFTNGRAASGNSYRTNGQVVKVFTGNSVTNAEIRYSFPPLATNDTYFVSEGSTLTVPPPGVVSNDVPGLSGTLAAILVNGPAHGALALNPSGGFSYSPAAGFVGNDSFSYAASDGVINTTPATVTLRVSPPGALFSDDFSRFESGDRLPPWQSVAGAGAVTNGLLQISSTTNSYGSAYVANAWTDYWVQGRVQFPAGAFGGGLGGRLNPTTGAHYAAWLYPEQSPGGASLLRLVKFQSWTSFGYGGSSFAPMQEVNLWSVGTNWHTLKLAFHTNNIAVYLDGYQVVSMPDAEPLPYLNGGITVDMWTSTTPYSMSVDDVFVSPLVVADSYAAGQNATLTVPAPGVLGNDTEVYGTNLAAVLVNGPTNGTLNLNADGGFSYSPATNFAGTDSFVYQATDGAAKLGTALVSLTVIPTLAVTADNQSRSYGADNPVLTGSVVGLQAGDNITASFSTVAETTSPVGDYPITISLSDPDHKLSSYFVTTNNGTLTVNPAKLTVTADNQGRMYGEANPTLTASIAGFVNGEDTNVLGGALMLSSPAETNSPVGSYPIITSGLASTNYSITFSNGTLSVTTASLTVVADNASRPYGAVNPQFSGTMTGLRNGDDIAASYATTATQDSPMGTYPITPTLSDPSSNLPNYSVSLVDGTLTVTAPNTPIILSVVRSERTNIVITWASVSNSVYRVQYKADPKDTNWFDLTPDITATNSSASLTVQPTVADLCYYRVALLP